MITIDAHSRDMVIGLIEQGETSKKCFKWMSQLRTYWDSDIDDSVIRICDASFPTVTSISATAVASSSRPSPIVCTSPRRRRAGCAWALLLQVLLELARRRLPRISAQLGKSMYVFNCAPEMDYRTMGDIFKGLAASGSWGCFDEFNRLVPEVLSVCSVQYKCVIDAQKRKANMPGRGLDYVDKEGVKHEAIKNYKFVAADGVEMPSRKAARASLP